jgi:hypothetical protein
LPAGTHAYWSTEAKTATCPPCVLHATAPVRSEMPADSTGIPLYRSNEAVGFNTGTAGASADREARRRRSARKQRIRTRHPRIGGFILAVSESPQSTEAWAKGAEGERKLAAGLDRLGNSGVIILHDRRAGSGRSNIDHLAITPGGVWVIDTKRYRGKVERRDKGGLLRVDDRLYVAGRDRTKLADGVARQVASVRAELMSTQPDLVVRGVLCFVDSEWGFLARPFTLEGIVVTWPKALYKLLAADGPVPATQRDEVAGLLARSFPAA